MKTEPSNPSPPATVFVVDDDDSFLRSLSRLLRVSGFRVKIHNSPAGFLSEVQPDLRGCVIADLVMPGMDGIAMQAALQKAGCALPVIFLTGHGDIPTTVKAMLSGADDFLTKQAPGADLIAAVHRALAHDEQRRAERARLQALRQPFEKLTDREREVLGHVVQGKLNKQIAADLGIHERTVKLHRTHITTKLQVHSVAELTRLVQEAGVFRQLSPKGSTGDLGSGRRLDSTQNRE
jgi:two-component system response regulator FixJ